LINYQYSYKLCFISGKDLAPENVDEFDKLVLTSPDSSLCWIQYIAFHMERKDYTLARTVVKRALEKINFREEKERFNIYMAWFNLENNFGTEDDTNKVFKEALQCNDEYKVIYVYLYDQMVNTWPSSSGTNPFFKKNQTNYFRKPPITSGHIL
jgi:hypothetical protein